MHIIDPNNRGEPSGEISRTVVPKRARKFGHVPDLSACFPGDLILFHKRGWSVTDWLIASSQARHGLSIADSAWTHAAIFLYDDFILEAVPNPGVQTRSLYDDVPGRLLRVRRNQNLNEVDRYKVALRAQRMLGARYSGLHVIEIGAMIWGLMKPTYLPRFQSSIICSQVFFDAHADITRSFLAECPIGQAVFPGHLSATPDLEDVQVGWATVAT